MKKVPVTLASTEVIDGVKRRPGDVAELAEDDPIAVKTLAAAKAADTINKAEEKNARRN